jgi:hypothetical protein
VSETSTFTHTAISDSRWHLFKFCLLEQILKRGFEGVSLLYSELFKFLYIYTKERISPLAM